MARKHILDPIAQRLTSDPMAQRHRIGFGLFKTLNDLNNH